MARLPLAVVVVPYAVVAYVLRWNSDDAFVSFRAVANLLAGHGPNYNAGERVEAFTNPLWVALLSLLGGGIGAEHLEWIAVWAGIVLSALGLALTMLAAVRLDGRERLEGGQPVGWVVPLFGAVLAGIRAFQEFATSGLETGLAFFAIGACLYTLFDPLLRRPRVAGLLLSLLPLVRPDFALYSAGFGGWLLWRAWRSDRGWRCILELVVCLGALPVAYQIFRMGYYALLVPNTAIAKEAAAARWDQGFFYLWNFASTYHLGGVVLAYAVLAVGVVRRAGRGLWLEAVGICAAVSLLHAAYVTRVGGDFMHARLLLPDLWILVAPLAALRFTPRGESALGSRRIGAAVVSVALAWSLVGAVAFRLPYEGIGPRYVNNEWTLWRSSADSDYIWSTPIVPSAAPTPNAGDYHLAGNAGVIPYSFAKYGRHEVVVIDHCGLGDPIISRQLADEREFVPGHAKCVSPETAPWVVGRHRALRARSPVQPAKAAFAERVLAATVAGEYLRAITEPLTFARFVENLRAAPRYTAFRLPPLVWFREVPRNLPDRAEQWNRIMLEGRRPERGR